MFLQKQISHFLGSALRRMNLILVLAIFSTSVSAVYTYTRTLTPEHAHAATSSNLNFQARLLSANGNTVPDGYYNIEFNLYSVSAGGSSLWTETRDFDGSDDRVRTVNGYLSVNLGSVNALPNIDWSQDLWLGMTVRGSATCAFATTCTPADSEMTPRTKLTAVPYALAAGNVRSANTTAASTNSDGVNITTGGASGATSNTGTITLQSGNSTTSGNTGGISLQSGNATSGNSGNITLDVGTASGTTGTISIGTANTSGITIGHTGVITTINGGLTVGSGSQFTNNSSTLNGVLAVGNIAVNGPIGANTATVDVYTAFTVNQTTSGVDVSLPNPTSATAGRIAYVLNIGTQSFTMHGVSIPAGYGQLYIWNGSNWRLAASGGGAAITLQAAYDGGNTITTDNDDLSFTLADTATDANFLLNIATGSTGEFKVQSNGTDVLQIGSAGQLQLDVQGNTGGLLIGTDANLYRSAADTLRTDDSLVVQGVLSTLRGSDYSTTGSLDDFNFGVASLVRLTGASTQTITGIASGTDGRILTIVNAAGQTAYINNDSASSSAGNKIYTGTGSNLAIPAGSSITLIYDAGASYWRIVGGAATSSSGAGAPFVQGGNSFAANAVLGTNDTFPLIFRTDNADRLQLTTSGDLEFLAAATLQTNVGALTLDAATALNLGTTDATSVSISRTGQATTVNGSLNVVQNFSVNTSQFTVDASNGNTVVAGTLTVGSGATDNDTLRIIGNTTLPTPTGAGHIFYNQTNGELYIYDGTRWQTDRSTATYIVAASDSINKDKADYVADGTDDQDTINAAINALPASPRGVVYLLEGTYNIDDGADNDNEGVEVDKGNTVLMGAGPSTILRNVNSINTNFETVSANAISNVTIRDLQIDGNRTGQSAGSQYGIDITGVGSSAGSTAVPGVTILNVYVKDVLTTGIRLTSTTLNSIISGVKVINSGVNGIEIGSSSPRNSIADSQVQGSGDVGILISSSDVSVTGTMIESSTNKGIYSLAARTTVSGNTLRSNGSGSNDAAIYMNNSDGSMVTGNNVSAGYVGIDIYGSSGVAVTGNTVSSTTSIGIWAHVGSTRTMISGNSVYLAGSEGIAVNTADYNSIVGNVVDSSTSHGIHLDSNVDHSIVSGNSVHNSASTGSSDGIFIDNSTTNNQITSNKITDTAGTGCAIDFATGTPATNTYLADNTYSGTGAASICNIPATTIQAGQVNSSNVFVIQGTAGVALNDGTVTSTATTFNLLQTNVTTLNMAGAATDINIGPTGNGASTIDFSGGSADTGCTIDGSNGNLVCSGTITSAGESLSLQGAYDLGNTILSTNARDIDITLADTATDANLVINVASGSTGELKVQSNGTDVLQIGAAGQLQLDVQGNTGGLLIGTDAQLYRSAVDTLRTPDALVVDGAFTGSLGTTISGGAISLNDSSNFATSINGGTSTGSVSIGNAAAGAVTLQSGSAGGNQAIILNSADTIELQDTTNVTGSFTVSVNADIAGTLAVGTADAVTITAAGLITTADDIAINGGDLTTTAGTFNLLNDATTVNLGSTAIARTINLGTGAAAQTVNIGSTNTTSTTNINAGSGGIVLSGNTSVANNSSFTIGTGSQFTNNSSTLLTAITNPDTATDTDIGTAATTVDIATTINKTQTTAGRVLTLPTPTSATAGRVVYINSVAASTQSFTMYGVVIAPSTSASFIWNGATWVATGGGSGVNTIGAVDTTPTTADGARISGSTLHLQYADATYAGLVSNTTQTFAGNKTFNGTLTVANSADINTNSTTALQVRNGATALITADTTNGRVSIGTAAPANGILTVGTNTTTAAGGLYFGTDTSLYRTSAGGLTTGGDFTALRNANSYTTLSVSNSNSGASAGAWLQLLNDSGSAGGFFLNSSTNVAYGGANSINLINAQAGAVALGTSNTVRLTIAAGGDVSLTNDLAVNGGDITSSGALNITPGGALTLGATGQTALLQGSITTITSTGATNDIILNSADTIELQDTTNVTGSFTVSVNADIAGTLAVGTADAVTITAAGLITTADDIAINGGDLTTTAGTFNLLNDATTVNLGSTAIVRTVNLGTGAAAQTVNIGSTNTTSTTNINAGSGGVVLTGNTSIANNSSFTVGTGSQFTNGSSTVLGSVAISTHAVNSTIGSAATTVDIATTFDITQTNSGVTLSLPTPTQNTTSGRIVYVNSLAGNEVFTIHGVTMAADTSAAFIYNGTTWVATSTGGNGVNTVGAVDTVPTTANGARISGSQIILQYADATYAGLVSNTTQTFAGNKTFTGLIAGQLGLTVTGAAVNLNASSNFDTNINTGTSTGAVNIGNGAAGAVTLQSGTGNDIVLNAGDTIELQDNTNITGTLNVSVNADIAGTLAVGTADALTITAAGNLTTAGTISSTNAGGKTTLTLTSTAADTGLTIGGDTNLYRSAADTLRTDDNFIAGGATNGMFVGDVGWSAFNLYGVSHSARATQTDYALLQSNTGLTIINASTGQSIDFRLNNSVTNQMRYNATGLGVLGAAPTSAFTMPTGTTEASGITFGTAADRANLYRSAADTLRTDDTFSVNGNLTVTASTGDLVTAGDAAINGGDLTSTAATVNLFRGVNPTTINIGDDANAKTITVGNTTGASALNLRVGTGNFTLDGVGASTFAVGASTTTGTITIGGTAQTGTITLGSSSGTNTVAIGNGAGATTVNISNNNTGGAVNIGAGFTTGTISIGGTGLQTGTISIGSGTGAQIINLGNGSGAKTINIGGSGANVIGIANTQTAGSVSIGAAMTSGTVNIGGTGAQTGTIDLGVGTGAQAINLGTGGTAAKTVTIGNSSVAGSTTTIQGGSTSGVLVKADGANAFRIQNTAGSVTALTADTSATPKITIGAATGTLTNRNLEVALVDVTTTIRMGDGTNGVSYNDAATGASGKLRYYGTARNTKTIGLIPEYAGAVMTGDGSTNTGTMTSDFCSNSSPAINNGAGAGCQNASEKHNYYSWTAQATNDYDIYVRYQMPSDFSGFSSSTAIQMYGWRTSATESVDLTLYNASGNICGTANTVVSGTNTTWTQTALAGDETSLANCTAITAGSYVTFVIHMSVGTNNNYARAGEISFDYYSNF